PGLASALPEDTIPGQVSAYLLCTAPGSSGLWPASLRSGWAGTPVGRAARGVPPSQAPDPVDVGLALPARIQALVDDDLIGLHGPTLAPVSEPGPPLPVRVGLEVG